MKGLVRMCAAPGRSESLKRKNVTKALAFAMKSVRSIRVSRDSLGVKNSQASNLGSEKGNEESDESRGKSSEQSFTSDLHNPVSSWTLQLANAVAAPVAHLISLDPPDLMAAARRRCVLNDFGDRWFVRGLEVLTASLRDEARLPGFGRVNARYALVQLLENRLRLEKLFARHPEIEIEVINRPVVIVGPPRSGTTHLHNALAVHPELRAISYWESVEPIPRREETRRGVDGRRDRACPALTVLDHMLPRLRAMHEMTAEAAHEEIQLLAMSFSGQLFETTYHVPSYVDWYRRTDQTPACQNLRRVLQSLQWLGGGRRWVLKAPQHLEQLDVMLTVFRAPAWSRRTEIRLGLPCLCAQCLPTPPG